MGGVLLPTVVAANRGTSSKPARFIRHRRRFADFPARPVLRRTPCHAPVGRGVHTPPPRTYTVLLAKGVIAKPVRTLAVAIRIPLLLPPAGHFLPTAAESTQITPPKPMVLESFARLGCIPCGKPPTTRTERAGLPPCFRVVSAPPSAGRSRGPALPWRGGDTPCVYRAARCGHRALRNSIDKRCVGGGVPDAPFHRTPCHAPVGGVPTPRRRYAPHLPAGHIIPAGGAEPAPTHRKKIPRTASLPSSGPSQKNDRPRRSFFLCIYRESTP